MAGHSKRVRVVAYDPTWAHSYAAEAEQLVEALGAVARAIHHIGSTSIPGIYAKPIVDILLEVDSLEQLDAATPTMEQLGYEVMGEYGIAGRRYFRKDDAAGTRTHHVHAFEQGCEAAVRHLAFRDYLIAHPAEAERYGELKRELAHAHRTDMDAYVEGKAPYIQQQQAIALDWWAARRGGATTTPRRRSGRGGRS